MELYELWREVTDGNEKIEIFKYNNFFSKLRKNKEG